MIKENKYNKLMEEDCLEVVIHKYVLNKIRKWAIRKIITNDHCEFLIDYEKENFVKRFEQDKALETYSLPRWRDMKNIIYEIVELNKPSQKAIENLNKLIYKLIKEQVSPK